MAHLAGLPLEPVARAWIMLRLRKRREDKT
jgi:hypothetical protein